MENDFPSNSVGKKRTAKTPEPPVKKVEKIVEGEAILRKPSLGRRFKETFIGGDDARSVWSYVLNEVMIPAAKDMIVDSGMEALNRAFYGDSRGGRRGTGSNPFNKPPWQQPFGNVQYNQAASAPPKETARKLSRHGRAQHDFREILLHSRAAAEDVLDALEGLIGQYEQCTVADLYNLVGATPDFTDEKYGWYSIQGARAVRDRGGMYTVDLPKPVVLD